MSEVDKKIRFTAEDGVTGKAKQIYSEIVNEAKKYSAELKAQTGYIKDQLSALEKANKVATASDSASIHNRQKQVHGLSPGEGKDAAQGQVNKLREQAAQDARSGAEIANILRQLLSETKQQHLTAEKAEKEQEYEAKAKEKYVSLNQAREEALRDPKATAKAIKAAEKSDYKDLSVAEIQKLNYQKQFVQKEPESNFKSTLKALLVNDLVQGLTKTLAHVASHETGEQAANAAVGAIPIVGPVLSQIYTRSFNEQTAVFQGMNKLQAMSGKAAGFGGNVPLGFSSKDALGLQEGMLNAAGSANNLGRNVSQAQGLERGLGLNESMIIQAVQTARYIGSSADAITLVSKVLKTNPDLVKDQTKTSEVMNAQLSLVQQLSHQTENVDMGQASGIIGLLRSVGGSMFNNPEMLSQNVSGMNQALSAPQSQFQKARSFGVLNRIAGGGSYLKMMEMQEKGIGQKGYLSSMLAQLQRETGGGENFALAAKQNLGLSSYSTAEALTKNFAKNPNKWANFKGTNDDISELVGEGRAKKLTSGRQAQAAQISESYLEGPFKGLTTSVAQYGETVVNRLSTIIEKLTGATITKLDTKPSTGYDYAAIAAAYNGVTGQ